jgi:2-polyprenyl-6-methoxyphenol hydroxylase-like FAD-dependent oxidoreductase
MLRLLYDTLPDSSQVLVDNAVTSVELKDSDLMRVTTHDGSVYHGNLVVGADGAHSRVRSEMWRLANSKSPGVFPEHEMSGGYCQRGMRSSKADYISISRDDSRVCLRFRNLLFHPQAETRRASGQLQQR